MYTQIIMLFALIFSGMFLCKAGVLNKTVNLGINKMVLYFAFPCMIAYKIGTMDMTKGLLRDFVLMLVIGSLCFVLFALISTAYYRLRGMTDRITRPAFLSTILPNNGFIGYPVTIAVYGQAGLLLMIAHAAIIFNLFVFTFGIVYLRRDSAKSSSLTPRYVAKVFVDLIKNPIILSIPAGLIILFCGIPLDNIFGDYLSTISDMASPLAMIYVGAAIGEGNVMETFKDRTIWEISFVKLIVIPVITGLAVFWLPVSPLLRATLILGASFPCAAIPVMLGQQEGLDYSQAAKALLLSTLLSAVTLPVTLGILSALIPM